MKYTANAPQGFKYKLKRTVKKIVQPFRISEKDKGKLLYNKFLSMPVNDKFIFYEAFAGLGILDNPRAIFKYLLNQEDFKSYTHIWSVENPELAADNISEFSSLLSVIMEYGSSQMDESLLHDLMDMRALIECECARLACLSGRGPADTDQII